ncbi:MAG: UDP-glucose 4-epimerase GalE [Acidobacteriota bacterium]
MIAVIGGAGYIGSLMVKRLLAKSESVVVFDNLSRGHREAVRPGAELVEGDLRRPQDLERLFAGRAIECVMHFAALASVGESVRVPELYYDNNLVGCFHLLEAMRAHGARRLIFSSTAATYGEPETVPIDEQHSQIPTNPYGETKRAVEQMLRWYHGAHGLSSISLRYFNAAGADPEGELGEHHEPEEHLIPNVLFAAAGRRGPVHVFGDDWPTPDGTCVRDYVHIDDLCSAHYLALERLRGRDACEAFNLGFGDGFSVLEVIRAAEAVTGQPIPWQPAARRPGDPARLVASAEKARRELGWTPRSSALSTILTHAWAWHRSHPAGYG